MSELYDVVIIGSGPAGMSAALYAGRANLKTLMIEKGAPGGQLLNTDSIENYLGAKSMNASQLAMDMYKDAMSFGAEYTYGNVKSVYKNLSDTDRTITVETDTALYITKTVIVATGTLHKKLGIPGEETFDGKGVSYCATCDGAFFQDKEIAVVGGGDSALEAANYLTQYGDVKLIHRRDTYRGEPHLQELIKKNEKIKEVLNTEVTGVIGEKSVERLYLQNKETGTEESINAQGLFINIGQIPQTDFLDNTYLTEEGWVKVEKDYTIERFPGAYAIGDVIDKDVRQVANAVGEGSEVIHYIFNYIQTL